MYDDVQRRMNAAASAGEPFSPLPAAQVAVHPERAAAPRAAPPEQATVPGQLPAARPAGTGTPDPSHAYQRLVSRTATPSPMADLGLDVTLRKKCACTLGAPERYHELGPSHPS